MTPVRRFGAWIRAQEPFRVDVAVTLLFLVAWAIEVTLLADNDADEKAVTAIFGVLAILPLAWRRRAPLVTPLAVVAVCVAQAPFDSFLVDSSTVPFIALFLALYSLGRYAQGREMWVTALVSIGGLMLALTLESLPSPDDVLWVTFLLGAPLLAGRALRNRARLNAELRQKAERAEAEREQRAREAIEGERSRIASELQAVVANGVSAMVVQAEAVPRLLEAGDPGRAAESLSVIEETGRDALTEMRRLLGVLRRDEDGAELAPQPTLSRAAALVQSFGGDGMRVELVVEGDDRELAPGVDLAAYRVLEQGLAAAREGEASDARVLIRYAERELELQVSDDRGAATADRAELAALRERLSIYGGDLSAGGRDGGGFELRARLPREAS